MSSTNPPPTHQPAMPAPRPAAVPLTPQDNVSPFVREQRNKNREIARMRELDAQSLRSLNSPLPAPGRRPPPAPAPAPPSGAPARPPARSSSDLSLASLTMARKNAGGGGPAPAPAPARSVPKPNVEAAPRLNLFEMTKLKQNRAPSAAATPGPTGGAGQRRPAVRQRLPSSTSSYLADDDEDDDDDSDNLMRSGAPGLTVADALKQKRKSGGGSKGAAGRAKNLSADDKAKMWGIDINKFK